MSSISEQRMHPRTPVNWRVEYTGASGRGAVHESSKLQDYSPSGACFFTMSEVQVGHAVDVAYFLAGSDGPTFGVEGRSSSG